MSLTHVSSIERKPVRWNDDPASFCYFLLAFQTIRVVPLLCSSKPTRAHYLFFSHSVKETMNFLTGRRRNSTEQKKPKRRSGLFEAKSAPIMKENEVVDDTMSIGISSWANISTSLSPTEAERMYKSDGAINYGRVSRGNVKPKALNLKDDASVAPSISSWGAIDIDEPTGIHPLCSKTRPFKQRTNIRSTNKPPKPPRAGTSHHKPKQGMPPRPPAVNTHARESSWGKAEVFSITNIEEEREQVAQALVRKNIASKKERLTASKVGSSSGQIQRRMRMLPLG